MIQRDWIAAEFSKGINAERQLAAEAKARAEAPPEPGLAVLYNEIAVADERHCGIVEIIATRYGYTPTRSTVGGIGETLSRLSGRVSEMGASPLDLLGHDLADKANAVHWSTAWVHTFGMIGETESARELAAILTEDKAHRDALQQALNRLVEQGAQGAK
ncbi:MAG: hypothetical protein ABI353_02320 [Isosphaeraceae bacterium]